MLSIMLGYSKYYVDNLSENIKRGKRQKLKNGIWPQLAPLGYRNDKTTRSICIDPAKGPLVRKSFELYATGDYTFARVRELVSGLGLLGVKGRVLSVSNYQYIIGNPIYYGLIRFKGEYYEGKHEPLITKELFDRCQEVMKRKSKAKSRGFKPYLYRAMFRCGECGGFMTIETQKGHNYLRCTKKLGPCSQPYVREEEISRQVTDYLRRAAFLPHEADELVAVLEAERNEYEGEQRQTLIALRKHGQSVDERLGRLMNAYLSEAIDLNEYKPAKNRLVVEKLALQDQIVALEKNRSSWLEPAINWVKASKSAGLLAETGTEEEKRDFFKKVGSNPKITDRHLSAIPRGAWQLVVDQGSFAQHDAAAGVPAAASLGETHQISTMRRAWYHVRTVKRCLAS